MDVGRSLLSLAVASVGLAGQRRAWSALDAFSLLADEDDAEGGR